MPIVTTTGQYPSLEDVLNLIRALANDSFAGANNVAGEGQILTDLYQGTGTLENPFLLVIFNSAIREMYRKLRNVKTPALIRDNFILLNLPVINGPLGASVPDPTVQTALTFAGYFDGTVTTASLALPSDLLQPLRIWERLNGSNDIFVPMAETLDGLQPRTQTDMLTKWEWREGQVNFVGATQPRDIRLRYLAFLPTFFANPVPTNYFTNTLIPIFDCQEAVAYAAVHKLATALGSPLAVQFKASFDEAIFDLKNQQVRRAQSVNYTRREHTDDDAMGLDIYGI